MNLFECGRFALSYLFENVDVVAVCITHFLKSGKKLRIIVCKAVHLHVYTSFVFNLLRLDVVLNMQY